MAPARAWLGWLDESAVAAGLGELSVMSETVQIEGALPERPEVANGQLGLRLDQVISHAQQSLIALQKAEGYWQAPLEANAEMNAEYIIFTHFMDCVDPELEAKLKKLLLELQQPDGSWSLFPGGEGYLSTTIEAYFALKLAGMRAGDEEMGQGRRWVLARGGVPKAGSLARFYLAALGQVPWEVTTAVPVEIRVAAQLVSGQCLRAVLMGARHAVWADAAAGHQTGSEGKLRSRHPGALHRAAALYQVSPAAGQKPILAARDA